MNFNPEKFNNNNMVELNPSNLSKSKSHHYSQSQASIATQGSIITVATTADLIKPPPKTTGVYRQVFVVLVICLSVVAAGQILSYPSVMKARENITTIYDTPLNLTKFELDSLGSTINLGAVIGQIACAALVPRLGRKVMLVSMAAVIWMGWVGISLSPSSTLIIVFRFLTGIGYGGTNMVGMAFVVELCDDDIRPLTTLLIPASNTIGQILGLLPSMWVSHWVVSFMNTIVCVLFLVLCIAILPESPSALVLKGKEEKARSIMRKISRTPSIIDDRIDQYKDINKMYQEFNLWQSIKQPEIMQGVFIVCGLYLVRAFSGYDTFVSQTARIIEDSGIKINPIIGSMLVLFTQLIGVMIAMVVVRKVGRRGSLLLSHIVMAVPLAGMGTYTVLYGDITTHDGTEHPYLTYVPLACLCMAMIGSSLGLQNIPLILATEYFPTAIRPQMSAICLCCGRLAGMLTIALYTPMQEYLSQGGLLYLYSGVSFLAMPVSYYFVKETVGKNVG